MAVADLLPAEVTARPKSIYPSTPDPVYAHAVYGQLAGLLQRPDAPLFDLVDHGRLSRAFAADPSLPAVMAVRPGPTAPAAYLLDINQWLACYQVRLA
jgi:asparagine synthase (glutamine-hydrolysing)